MARKPAIPKISYPTCVRHQKERKDTRLRHFFLCDKCTDEWVVEAFDGTKSLYDGEAIDGYCMLCNSLGSVRLRTWFLCDICCRVAGSIGRNHEAENSILKFWEDNMKRHFPNLTIQQMDPSSLRPRRKSDTSGEGPLDFHVFKDGKLVFGIENKTGRSSIQEMSKFQLDVSDCDSILYHVNELNIPAYIIHAQVLEIWKPPTVGFVMKGLWWTDIYKMTESFMSIHKRGDENRSAAYFKKTAFSDITTFLNEITDDKGKLSLVEKFNKEGVPSMYILPHDEPTT